MKTKIIIALTAVNITVLITYLNPTDWNRWWLSCMIAAFCLFLFFIYSMCKLSSLANESEERIMLDAWRNKLKADMPCRYNSKQYTIDIVFRKDRTVRLSNSVTKEVISPVSIDMIYPTDI